MLLRLPENKMCCIGFLARELGCKRSEIAGVGTLRGVGNPAAQSFDQAYGLDSRAVNEDCLLEQAYATNDDPDIDDTTRIRQLKEIGKQMGVRFIFK